MSFQDRRDSFEIEMAHNEDLAFKIKMRRTKLAAQQVAVQCKMPDADAYVADVIGWFVENMNDGALIARFISDAVKNGVTLQEADITLLIQNAQAEAEKQLKSR